jgi:hypothetical protein
MPVDRFLERTAKNENDEDEWHAEQNDAPFGDTTSHADTRGQPDTGCGGQALHVLTVTIPDDDAHAKKPDAGQDTLDNAAHFGATTPADGEDGQCRPDPDEAKRANARWLAVKIAVKAQRDASQRRSTEPQSNVEGIHDATI